MPLLNFTDEEIPLVRSILETIRSVDNSVPGGRSSKAWSSGDSWQTPDTYVALVPPTGIPALTFGADDKITGTGANADIPGCASCQIWKIASDGTADPSTGTCGTGFRIEQVGNQSEIVYNVSLNPITEQWIPITRSKFGRWLADVPGSTIRLGSIIKICDGGATGVYRVDIFKNSDLSDATCTSEDTEFTKQICCDIVDDDSGEFLDCQGYETTGGTGLGTGSLTNPNIRGDCVATLAAPTITGTTDITVNAQDLDGRQLPIGTVVSLTKIGELWVILKAGLSHSKVCVLSDIDCAIDCEGNSVFLRTFTPVWLPDWSVCGSQSEFIPNCG